MVAAPTWRAVRCLPTMRHFMHKGAQNFLVGSTIERVRIHGELVDGFAILTVAKAVGGKIPAGIALTLKRNECRGQGITKKMLIEPFIRVVKCKGGLSSNGTKNWEVDLEYCFERGYLLRTE
jgi:hypothetical protein